jgi:hypothetical protein
LALDAAKRQQRVIFFCACKVPAQCHRAEVVRLVSAAARKRRSKVEITEWPGGDQVELKPVELKVSNELLLKVRAGRRSIPLPESADLVKFGSLPWCSRVLLKSGQGEAEVICSPAEYSSKLGWYLSTLEVANENSDPEIQIQWMKEYREEGGYDVVA